MPAGVPSLPLSVPGGLFLAPLGSSMPSSIGFHAHQALYGGSPRSNGHVELFQRSSLPSGGSLPLKLPRSGSAPDADSSMLPCDMHVTTTVRPGHFGMHTLVDTRPLAHAIKTRQTAPCTIYQPSAPHYQ